MIRTASNVVQTGGHNQTLVTILGTRDWRKPTWLAVRHQRLELVGLAAQIKDKNIKEKLSRASEALEELEDILIPEDAQDAGADTPEPDDRPSRNGAQLFRGQSR